MRLIALTHVETSHDEAGASLLSFRPDRPFTYRAGQFGLWIAGSAARPFTIASAPGDTYVQLGTRLHPESRIKRALTALAPGDRVHLVGPIGHIAPADDGRPIVFAVQGIGITVARALLRQPAARRRFLIHTGTPYFRPELETLADSAAYPRHREEFSAVLHDATGSAPDAHYIVTGSGAFVSSTRQSLRAAGVPRDRLHTDTFLGLPDRP